jgi:ABC-2 type transport system permease protein
VSGVGALLGAELRRFFSRRVVRVAFALGIALATLVLVILIARSAESTTTQRATTFSCPPEVTNDPISGFEKCTPQEVTSTVHHDRRLRIHDNLSATVKGTGYAMILIAFVLGASFIGAEFNVASLGTQLLFEPRRARVVVVKAIAVGIGIAVLSVALLLYIGALQWVGSEWRGVVSGLDGEWFAARAGDILRVTAATAAGGMAAYAITVVARRTVAAVAGMLMVGYLSLFLGSSGQWRWITQDNPTNVFAALVLNLHGGSNSNDTDFYLTGKSAAVGSGLWVVALTVIAVVIFSRREVR